MVRIEKVTPSYIIRDAHVDDALSMFDAYSRACWAYEDILDRVSWQKFKKNITKTPERLEKYKNHLLKQKNDPHTRARVLVVSNSNIVAGYYKLVESSSHIYISNLYVDSIHQRRGYGAALLEDALQQASGLEATLWVLAGNHPAVSLYQKHGFIEVKSRKKFFYDAAMVYMRKANL